MLRRVKRDQAERRLRLGEDHELTSLSFAHVRGRFNASKAASTDA